jgi:anti-sigma regulatory factor (Ser/Thr protein kinase)
VIEKASQLGAYPAEVNSRAVRDDLGDIGPAIAWAGEFADRAGLSADVRYAVDLSLEEALANLIMHGVARNGDKGIELAIACEAGGVTLTLSDRCAPFDITAHHTAQDETDLSPGGRGIRLLRSFAPNLDYAAGGDRNRLTMRFPTENAVSLG